MKAVLAFGVLAVSALLLFGAEPENKVPLVFVLGGQSNMVGYGRTAELPAELRQLPPGVEYYLDGKKTDFERHATFGPEVAFVHEMAKALPGRRIVIVKYAVGGTSLLAWAPEWNAERAALTWNRFSGRLYGKMMKILRELNGSAPSPYAAILWMQGERDAQYRQAAREYGTNLKTLVQAFRRDLQTPDLPFVLGMVDPPAENHPALDMVRAAQQEAERVIPRTAVVSTSGLGKLSDRLHYDTQGQIELGRRFARTYLERFLSNSRPEEGSETARGMSPPAESKSGAHGG